MIFIQLRKQHLSKWKNNITLVEVAGGRVGAGRWPQPLSGVVPIHRPPCVKARDPSLGKVAAS